MEKYSDEIKNADVTLADGLHHVNKNCIDLDSFIASISIERNDDDDDDKLQEKKMIKSVLEWIWGHDEISCATELSNLGLKAWEEIDWDGTDELVLGGYHNIIDYLLKNIEKYCRTNEIIQLNTAVTLIDYNLNVSNKSRNRNNSKNSKGVVLFDEDSSKNNNDSNIKIYLSDGNVVQAKFIICTIPLPVLKNNMNHLFNPPLPESKKLAINNIGVGILNWVILQFSSSFWNIASTDYIGLIHTKTSSYTPKSFVNLTHRYNNIPTLGVEVIGEDAWMLEKLNDEEIIEICLKPLKCIFKEIEIRLPKKNDNHFTIQNKTKSIFLTKYYISRWGSDPYFQGAYAYLPIQSTLNEYLELSKPICNNRIRFAGEATCTHAPNTTTGAFDSGIREAKEILKILQT